MLFFKIGYKNFHSWLFLHTFAENKNSFNMLKEGLEYTSTVVVAPANCASAVGSGGLDVFATPSMVALMENAAMNCVAPYLPEGSTTVGAEINTTHIKPSSIGSRIKAIASIFPTFSGFLWNFFRAPVYFFCG